jgi:predicted phosphodiesterase
LTGPPFYSLAHVSDTHLSFRADGVGLFGRWYARFGGLFPEADFITYVNTDVLREAWRNIETLMRRAAQEDRISHLLVTGDICTWPYEASALAQAYGIFSNPDNVYQQQTIGFSPEIAERLIMVIGNHDTFNYVGDRAYRTSLFHTEHQAAAQTRTLPINVRGRWIVYFIARTDCLLGLGWLGGRPLFGGQPLWLRRLHAEHVKALAGRSESINGQGCSADDYATALKLLVLHHSPLEHEYYAAMSDFHYLTTQLTDREAIPEFCREVGIPAVMFGHSHDPKDVIVDGTLYLDAGTVAATSVIDMMREREISQPLSKYSFKLYDFHDDNAIAVRTFEMIPPAWSFRELDVRRYRLIPGAVAELG